MKNTHAFTVAQTLPPLPRRVGPESDPSRRPLTRTSIQNHLQVFRDDRSGTGRPHGSAPPPPFPVGSGSSEAIQQNSGPPPVLLDGNQAGAERSRTSSCSRAPFVRCFCSARLLNPNSQHLDNKGVGLTGSEPAATFISPHYSETKGCRSDP